MQASIETDRQEKGQFRPGVAHPKFYTLSKAVMPPFRSAAHIHPPGNCWSNANADPNLLETCYKLGASSGQARG